MTERGERNNNPGNIDKGQNFKGEVEGDDDRFATFDTIHNGIRAIAVILLVYYHKHELHTVRSIIDRWAPSVENNTASYINDVASHIGVGPDDSIDVEDAGILDKLVTAIIYHEEGEVIYSSDVIIAAVNDALGN